MNSDKPRISSAFVHKDFRFFVIARLCLLTSHHMLNIALGQYLWERTHQPIYLGYLGLAFFLPKMTLALFSGHIADRYDRRKIILYCRFAQWFFSIGFLAIGWFQFNALWPLYLLATLTTIAYAFDGPAGQSIIPELVPPKDLPHAVTWTSTAVQLSFITGPVLAGWIYALSGKVQVVFYVIASIRFLSLTLIYLMKNRSTRFDPSKLSLEVLFSGLRFIFQKRLILSAISLDLFAVLLGGAVALLPIFANDILKVGPSGLGYLRAAPALGAAATALWVTSRSAMKNSGITLLSCVALFGLCTIAFALSKNFYLSLFILFILGAADMVSVVIRGVLVQTQTPPEMLGKVSAVNLVFIGASNELGEFESGVMAAWLGVIPSVIVGGVGTLCIVGIWTVLFPELRKLKRLHSVSHS
ncbi:MAG: MFS transporter [Deltaproteobacteria bacterium]|nr:MFS transporter [Deltaproteobacteria bacterium]